MMLPTKANADRIARFHFQWAETQQHLRSAIEILFDHFFSMKHQADTHDNAQALTEIQGVMDDDLVDCYERLVKFTGKFAATALPIMYWVNLAKVGYKLFTLAKD